MGYRSSYTGQEIDESISINSTQNDRLTAIEKSIQNLNNKIYPIGSIYISVNSTSPATLFGGTWEQLKDRFLLSAGNTYTAGSTGGEANHTLTMDEMPSHSHSTDRNAGWPSNDVGSDGWSINYNRYETAPYATWHAGTENTGGSQAHNNMPPYLTVYMWKRIS